ncbi:MAG: glycosyltransferase [Mariprofundaceae bacterium]|nr:glycosyltransferase [Mariprofundaceae bacterium]
MSDKIMPLVSIHIITYNQIDFIHETLDSALAQDYENLEIVVADDGSTDGTADVIMEYAKKYPEKIVALVGGPNLGITGNSNRGLKACKGKYIAFQGGDDVLLPGKITAQVEWMEADENRVLCGHQVEVFYDDGSPSHPLTKWFASGVGPKDFIQYGCPYAAVSIMVRCSACPKTGFNEKLPFVSDWFFWIETLENGGAFGYVEGKYARYRRHAMNITNNIELCSTDVLLTYDVFQSKFPLYADVISNAKSFAMLINQAKILRERRFFFALSIMIIKLCVRFPKNMAHLLYYKIKTY